MQSIIICLKKRHRILEVFKIFVSTRNLTIRSTKNIISIIDFKILYLLFQIFLLYIETTL